MTERLLVNATGIMKKFGGLTAVNKIDILVNEGACHAIIGPNGSGKTTFINILTGYYTPNEGSIIFDEGDITLLKPYIRTKLGIARTFQNIRLFEDMTVRENIALGMHCRTKYNFVDSIFHTMRYNSEEKIINNKIDEVAEHLDIKDIINHSVDNLAYGKRRIIEIARALATQPKLLLLDEPAAGMNNVEVNYLKTVIQKIRDMGITVLLIEHNMEFIKEVSDIVTVMENGCKIAEGNYDIVSNDPKVIEAYLGKGVSKAC